MDMQALTTFTQTDLLSADGNSYVKVTQGSWAKIGEREYLSHRLWTISKEGRASLIGDLIVTENNDVFELMRDSCLPPDGLLQSAWRDPSEQTVYTSSQPQSPVDTPDIPSQTEQTQADGATYGDDSTPQVCFSQSKAGRAMRVRIDTCLTSR